MRARFPRKAFGKFLGKGWADNALSPQGVESGVCINMAVVATGKAFPHSLTQILMRTK